MERLESFADHYIRHFTPYKDKWNYEDGCVLKGVLDVYVVNRKQEYYDFVKKYVDERIAEDGKILNYEIEEFNIDNIHCGKVLFDIYQATGEEKYKKAMDLLRGQLERHPRTKEGNFWHKKIYPNQVWLDGLYMAMPFYARYEKEFNNGKGFSDIYQQLINVKYRMRDPQKELYYHGYDESRQEKWSHPETGRSSNFWCRAMGWFLMALVDTLERMENEFPHWREMVKMFEEAVVGLLKYQDAKTGMWYQVIDQDHKEGNYLETSGTLMISYAILKGVRLGYLPVEYQILGENAFHGTIRKYLDSKTQQLHGICGVAGLGNVPYRDGSYKYYISEKIVPNDHKGVGALLMAYSEILRLG